MTDHELVHGSPDGGWREFRRQMPVSQKWAYFDHAAVSPLPEPTRRAIGDWADQAAREGDTVWPGWSRRTEQVRHAAASLIGATPQEIAFVSSTTAGINLVAEGFPWQPGDNIVTFANEFPSNLYPWMNLASRGVETRRVPVDDSCPDLQRLADACDQKTRIVTVSWVGYAAGWRLNLEDVVTAAHRCGALLFLDAIQGLGVFPLDVRRTPVDFLAADGHKWMLGPEGAGLFYVRREHLERLRPVGVGWNSVVDRYDYRHVELNLRNEAARYEGGSPNMVGVHGLGASLDLLVNHGAGPQSSAVGNRILDYTDRACQRLQRAGAQLITQRALNHRSGIVVFAVPGQTPESVRQRCREAGVVVSCRGGGVRISPHAYSDETDLDRLVDACAF